jgi:hypothetical protein
LKSAEVEGYFGLIFNNQPVEMIVVEMGRSSLLKAVCGLEVGNFVKQLDLPPRMFGERSEHSVLPQKLTHE